MPETHTSAGIIPLFETPDPDYLLLQYPQGHWGFPKGHLEADDETLWDAAERELKEETELPVEQRFEEFREILDYWYFMNDRRHHKTVYFFGGLVADRSVTLSEEHVDYGWFGREGTLDTITYDNEKNLFKRWLDFYDNQLSDQHTARQSGGS